MKVAVFSDVQGNLPAMEVAVEQIRSAQPDLVVMAGDLVNRGPASLACLQLFDDLRRRHGWLPVKGNHESWILGRHGRQAEPAGVKEELTRFADWTYRQLLPRLGDLADWPDHCCFSGESGDSWVHVTHGSMRGNRHGITAALGDEELRESVIADVALFVTAHTHRPLHRVIDGLDILNVGSVGSPFDGDPRGSYVLLEERNGVWSWEIVRFDYDRARAERDFHTSGFIAEGGPMARILFEEWRRARLLMPRWRQEFEPAVLAGERPLAPAVETFLASLGT